MIFDAVQKCMENQSMIEREGEKISQQTQEIAHTP